MIAIAYGSTKIDNDLTWNCRIHRRHRASGALRAGGPGDCFALQVVFPGPDD